MSYGPVGFLAGNRYAPSTASVDKTAAGSDFTAEDTRKVRATFAAGVTAIIWRSTRLTLNTHITVVMDQATTPGGFTFSVERGTGLATIRRSSNTGALTVELTAH